MAPKPHQRIARKIRKSNGLRIAAAWLTASYIRIIRKTTRWTVEGEEAVLKHAETGAPMIAVIWHGRLLIAPTLVVKDRKAVAMISNNNDGDTIARTVAHFGISSVRGSTYNPRKGDKDKGGSRAFRDAIDALNDGATLCMTPDGPRGPRMRAQMGAASLSIAANAVIVPVAFRTRSGFVLKNWDRFFVAFPFGRGSLIFGDILKPPQDKSPEVQETFRREIEMALNDITNKADEQMGHTPVQPASIENADIPKQERASK